MIMQATNVQKIFGKGCPDCLTSTGADMHSSICQSCGSVVAVHGASFSLAEGEILGIVGESGSGKSTLLQLLYQDQKANSGEITLAGFTDTTGKEKNLITASITEIAHLRDKYMAMIYQNPHLGLNYDFSAGGNIAERIIASGEMRYHTIRDTAKYFLDKTELDISRMDQYPDTFSGGQQQRIQISKALASQPKLLLLDEPTTGLDLSVQAKIIDLIKSLQQELGFAMIIVSHDLGVIKHLTNTTMVMKNGEIVEYGLTDQILEDPQHPYTQILVSSIL